MKKSNLIRTTILAVSLLLQLGRKGKTMKRILLLTTLAMGILGDTKAQAQPDGVPLWTNRYNGPANDAEYPTSMATDTNGNVFVTGYSFGIGSSYDYATIKYSSAGLALWTNRYNGPGNGADYPRAMAVDGSGNVFVTGSSPGSGGVSDYATIKYSGAGVPLWTNRYSGPGNNVDDATAMVVDSSGNVFVTGTETSASTNASPDGFDYATIKYSGTGVALWTNRYNGPGNKADRAVAMGVDTNGNVFVTGTSASSNASYSDGYATIKYSGAGVPLWTNRYDGPINGDQQASALAVDGSGNVFVTGYTFKSVYCNDGGCYYDYDYATIKYSGAGVPLWTNRYNGQGENGTTGGADDRARAMAVDAAGNVFVTGSSDVGFGRHSYDTIKYSGAGVPLWTKRYDGPYPIGLALAVDGRGNVFVTGGATLANGSGLPDYATTKYSNAGVPLWTNRYNGTGNNVDYATAMVVDSSGNVVVTGYSQGNGSGYDYATIKYSSTDLPSLNIARTTTNTVAISWPSPSTGFTLQQNTNLSLTNSWSPVAQAAVTNAGQISVTVPAGVGSRFFRLNSQ